MPFEVTACFSIRTASGLDNFRWSGDDNEWLEPPEAGEAPPPEVRKAEGVPAGDAWNGEDEASDI